jgi:hypothetical protein
MVIHTLRRPNLVDEDTATSAIPAYISHATQLATLVQEHRSLDQLITHLQSDPLHDVIQVARLKKRKLQLKDEIAQLSKSVSFQ